MYQTTLKSPVTISGIGIHSGNIVNMSIMPAPSNHGIVFERSDMKNSPSFRSKAGLVTNTTLCTVMDCDGISVATVEHFMSALSGLGIDNLLVIVDAPELPILDGSAIGFVEKLQKAGTTAQASLKQFITVTKEIMVTDGDKWAKMTPYSQGFKVDFSIDFDHPVIQQTNCNYSFELNASNYITHIAPARTFGFLKDIEKLHANNLALGGSLENAVVLDDHAIMNKEGLRFSDEFVRHKVLDAIGDLYLEGYHIHGHFTASKSGHYLNNKLFTKLLNDKDAFKMTVTE